MSDCSANAWHVPEQREPGVLYMHGHPGTDYAAVKAIEVDGERYERVRECEYVYDGEWFACSACGEQLGYLGMSVSTGKHGEVIREALHKDKVFCPYCGAKVKVGA